VATTCRLIQLAVPTRPRLRPRHVSDVRHDGDLVITVCDLAHEELGEARAVHWSDGSGTTYIFSNYLSSVSPAWAAKVGTGKTLTWPVGDGEQGNAGVALAVNRTPFSIGYIEEAYSQGLLLPFAAIRNQAGNYVTPSAQTVAADAAQKPPSPPRTSPSSTSRARPATRSAGTAGR
jgi:ABC-type phosphate transport system substrate-binding protein